MSLKGKKKKNQVVTANIFEQQKIIAKAEVIRLQLKASTWHELEPTGHYWFCLATWMVANGVSVVQVNPYAVKQTKEIEDNSQLKDDRKDPKLIANLTKDGNFGMPYLPEGIYADMRRLTMFRDQLTEDWIRCFDV